MTSGKYQRCSSCHWKTIWKMRRNIWNDLIRWYVKKRFNIFVFKQQRTNSVLWKLSNSIIESTNVLTELMQKQHAGRCICKETREFVLESSTKQGPKKNRTTTESEIDSIKSLTRLIFERATARVMERVHSPSSSQRIKETSCYRRRIVRELRARR